MYARRKDVAIYFLIQRIILKTFETEEGKGIFEWECKQNYEKYVFLLPDTTFYLYRLSIDVKIVVNDKNFNPLNY